MEESSSSRMEENQKSEGKGEAEILPVGSFEGYKIISEEQTVEGTASITYGIECGGETVRDISVNREFVEGIVEALNVGRVSSVHFRDVVEDFMCAI